MATKKASYEQSMVDLETLVAALEAGEMPLEEAIGAYERGMKLVETLEKLLGDAQSKVTLLTKDGEKTFQEDEHAKVY